MNAGTLLIDYGTRKKTLYGNGECDPFTKTEIFCIDSRLLLHSKHLL